MKDLLQQFLGGNPQRQQDYSDFLNRYQQDPSSVTDEEAARRYRELIKNAPQGLADEANQHGFGQVPEQDRSALADHFQDAARNPARPFDGYNHDDKSQAADPRNLGRMAQQAENQDPDLFDQLFGSNSPLSSPMGKAALAAGAAYLASRVLSGQGLPGASAGTTQGQSGGLGGLGGLLGGLTGGSGASGSGFGGEQQPQQPQHPQTPTIPGINLPDSGFDKQT